MELARLLSSAPAKILGIDKGRLEAGRCADIVVVDPGREWVVTKAAFASKSNNSPFVGRKLKGAVECTLCAGKIAYTAKNVSHKS